MILRPARHENGSAPRREIRTGIAGWLPALATARSYRWGWLRHDLVAGIVLTALLVPQGMAYAGLAGLPPVLGLYATMVPLLAYAVFGPSRILVLGPDSAVAPLVAATVIPLAGSDTAERTALAGLLALMVGAICVIAGLARFGFLTDLLSKPVRVGYLNGIALVVLVSQLPKLFGFSASGEGLLTIAREFVEGLDETNWWSLAVGVAALAVILAIRHFVPRLPGVLIAVVGATVVSWIFDLAADGVATVGRLPSGLPELGLPEIGLGDAGALVAGAAGIALVAFADTSVLSRSYATKLGEHVDQNRELVALGVANAATGVLQGFPISSSSSRTPVAEAAGAKTQLTGVVGAVGIGVILVAAPGVLADLPSSALAAVVIAAALSLADVGWVRELYRVRRSEWILSTASFLGVALVGVLWGIAIAVALSILNFLRRAWWPHDAVLGRVDGLKGYHDKEMYPAARLIPGLLLYRFDAPLFFANADVFRDRLLELVRAQSGPVAWVVVAAEPMTDVDVTAFGVLSELDEELERMGIELVFAELKDPVKERLARYGLLERIGRERFYPTIGVAVRRYLDEHPVGWTDWEDEPR